MPSAPSITVVSASATDRADRSRDRARRNAAPELAPAPDNAVPLAAIQNLHADLGSQIGAVRTGVEALAERTATVEHKVEVIASAQVDLRTDLASLQERVIALEQRPASSHTGSSTASSAGRPSRDPWACDPTILRINTPNLVGRSAVEEAFRQVSAAAGVPASAWVLAPAAAVASRFVVRIPGDASRAEEMAKRITASLRDNEGNWREVQVVGPSGAAIKLFIGPDRPRAEGAIRATTKRLARVLEQLRPDLDLDVAPRDGVISRQWIELASVEFIPAQGPIVNYNVAALRNAGYDFDQVRTNFVVVSSRRRGGRRSQQDQEEERVSEPAAPMAEG